MEKLIDTFSKNSVEEVRTALTEYKGHRLLDIRVWYEDASGERKPTKKGITIGVDLLPDLVKSIRKTQEAVKRETGQSQAEDPGK